MAVVRFGEQAPAGIRMQELFNANHTAFNFQNGPPDSDRATFNYTQDFSNAIYVGTWNGGTSFSFRLFQVGDAEEPIFRWSGASISAPNLVNFHETGSVIAGLMMNGNDQIIGSTHSDYLEGFAGHDVLLGGSGGDILDGGAGDDQLFSGIGGAVDIFVGGDGFDFVRYDFALEGVFVSLEAHAGFAGEAAGDFLASDIEGLIGSVLSDTFIGNANANMFLSSFGNDFLYGRAGVDTLFGDAGSDWLDGGADSDILFGGADLDYFVSNATDLAVGVFDYVGDFQDGSDLIVLQGWGVTSFFMFESGGNVFITSANVGYTGGLVVLNATSAQVQDQVGFI